MLGHFERNILPVSGNINIFLWDAPKVCLFIQPAAEKKGKNLVHPKQIFNSSYFVMALGKNWLYLCMELDVTFFDTDL